MGYVLDLSDDNGTVDYKEVGGAKAPDGSWLVSAVVCQATEGVSITNDTFRPHHNGFKTARPDGSPLPFGAYHFFYDSDAGLAQARFFLGFINGYQGQVLPMLDCEGDGFKSGDPAQYIAEMVALREAVKASLHPDRFPLIYFGLSFWRDTLGGYDGFSGGPAWPAAYNTDDDLDMTGTGFKSWTLWQLTDNAPGRQIIHIPGIQHQPDVSRLHPSLTLDAILR